MSTHNPEDIVRYVDEEMTDEERRRMETDIANDAALAADVELYTQLRGELSERLPVDPGAEALKKTLEGMNAQYFAKRQTGKIVSFRKYLTGVAAAASIIIVAVLLWPSHKAAFIDEFGGAQMVSGIERGGANDTLLQNAAAYFNDKDYSKALSLLDRVIAADSGNQEAVFYRGVARLHTGAIDAARTDLSGVYAGTSLFKYEAAFFMGLSYAQQQDKEKALEWLDRIPEGAPGWEKSKELRKKL